MEDKTFMTPILVDNTPLLGFVILDNHLFLNLVAFNEFNQLILHIRNNQLIYSIEPWDIQLVGRKLTVREGNRKILIEIEILPPNTIKILRGRLLYNGDEIIINKYNITLNNGKQVITGNNIHNCHGGLIVGDASLGTSGFLMIQKVNRYN